MDSVGGSTRDRVWIALEQGVLLRRVDIGLCRFYPGPEARPGADQFADPVQPSSLDHAAEALEDLLDDAMPLEREGGIELHQVCARLDLGQRGLGILNPAAADERHRPAC